jgi:cell division protein FtsB
VELNRRAAAMAARTLVAGIAAYYALWGGEYSAFDLLRLQSLQAEEEAALEDLQQRVDSLHPMARALESDPVAIERLARERFGMIRNGEVLYRFVYVGVSAAEESGETPPSP